MKFEQKVLNDGINVCIKSITIVNCGENMLECKKDGKTFLLHNPCYIFTEDCLLVNGYVVIQNRSTNAKVEGGLSATSYLRVTMSLAN